MTHRWSPDSWRSKVISQCVEYADEPALNQVLERMRRLPPLVTPWEVNDLKLKLAQAARGEAFLLQGGDCAESFDDCTAESITSKFKILLQMSVVLVHGTRTKVVRVGRIAGQYAKPRSTKLESRGDQTLPAYRGDIVNRSGFSSEERTPDPELLLRGYERAALTLNYLRALAAGGFSDLHHPENWDLSFTHGSKFSAEYKRVIDSIGESIAFMEAVVEKDLQRLRQVELFTSHEALSLHYEMAQTREDDRSGGWYNLSTHLPWIGMRTAALDGAHVEYCRGIKNPVGIKVGTSMSPEWLTALLDALNPENEPGRIVLIQRMGHGKVASHLPPLIEAVKRAGKSVLWCADPMHGNTETTPDGLKTRRFERILGELEESFEVHQALGSRLGGVHFELTGEDVTECIGGARGLSEADLHRAYKSKVDPRLNYEQALEMALSIAKHLRK